MRGKNATFLQRFGPSRAVHEGKRRGEGGIRTLGSSTSEII